MVLGFTLSVFIGLALGLFGGGGSILAVPILTYVMGVPAKAAIASSLLIVGITSAVGLVTLARRGLVDVRTGLEFGFAAMLGAYASGRLAHFIPDAVLLTAFGVMMLVTAVAMLRGSLARGKRDSTGGASLAAILLRGLGVGAIAGLMGAGGGFLIVPALVLLGGMPMRKAVATSLLVISLQSFAGFAGHAGHAAIPWHLVVPVIVLSAAGSLVGGALVGKIRPEALRRGFAWLVLAVAVLVIGHQMTSVARGSALYAALFVTPWPWWVGGAAIALVALGLLFVENKLLGVSTGCG
ncbi:MAG TPA: sulfite exporter TauE/SafE family protein, partial [Polyangiaceae bacterium]|nr:sulfite exporter TauE/SafE family protein [Polyangiaceae bacterium]